MKVEVICEYRYLISCIFMTIFYFRLLKQKKRKYKESIKNTSKKKKLKNTESYEVPLDTGLCLQEDEELALKLLSRNQRINFYLFTYLKEVWVYILFICYFYVINKSIILYYVLYFHVYNFYYLFSLCYVFKFLKSEGKAIRCVPSTI